MDWIKQIEKLEGWSFGDSSKMADELGKLVVEGKKTATSSLLKLYEVEDEPIPKVGDRSFIKNSEGHPLCVIEVEKVEILPFKNVDESLAGAEGEGDLSLEYWRKEHTSFFQRSYPDFHEDMEIVSEYFKVIHIFEQND